MTRAAALPTSYVGWSLLAFALALLVLAAFGAFRAGGVSDEQSERAMRDVPAPLGTITHPCGPTGPCPRHLARGGCTPRSRCCDHCPDQLEDVMLP